MIASILKGCEGVAIVTSAVSVLVLMDCRQEMKWSGSLSLNSLYLCDMETFVCHSIFVLCFE